MKAWVCHVARGAARWTLTRRAGLAGLAAGALLAGCYTLPTQEDLAWIEYSPPPPVAAGVPRSQRNLAVFDWAWSTVQTYYYDTRFHGIDWPAAKARYRAAAEAAPDDVGLYAVINSMLGELKDGHTRARSPREVAERRERRWIGIGLEVAPMRGEPDRVVVSSVWQRGPAARAGVRRGWILQSCNGQGAKAYLAGRRFEEGEPVACVFQDGRDRPRAVELVTRSVYFPPVREVSKLDRNTVYVRFDEFKYGDVKWLYRQLLIYNLSRNMILDLRYNTGGDVFCLELIAGLFLPDRQALGSAVKSGLSPRAIASRRPRFTPYYEGEVAVLVSGSTSSAAEILTHALRNNRRSTVIGQRTVGHVLNAYQGELPDGGEISFSIRDFLTPDGQHLEGRGLDPDIPLTYHIADLRAGRDPGIDTAMVVLRLRHAEPGS